MGKASQSDVKIYKGTVKFKVKQYPELTVGEDKWFLIEKHDSNT